MEEYLKLKQLVEEIADDIYKAQGGKKAAGTRVRKIMQDIKNTAQDVRRKVLEMRGDEGPPTQG
ncbi:MAG: histone H1 [Planctomycetes bacterium]|nr:histone H1 [Planctomycetota bacterium]